MIQFQLIPTAMEQSSFHVYSREVDELFSELSRADRHDFRGWAISREGSVYVDVITDVREDLVISAHALSERSKDVRIISGAPELTSGYYLSIAQSDPPFKAGVTLKTTDRRAVAEMVEFAVTNSRMLPPAKLGLLVLEEGRRRGLVERLVA